MNVYSIPTDKEMEFYKSDTADYMRPNVDPFAVVFEEFLTRDQCNAIIRTADEVQSYRHGGCGAETREYPRPVRSELEPIVLLGENVNRIYWSYDLDENPAAWMQVYYKHGDYPKHVDTRPGTHRKLTAVALLGDHNTYAGGELLLYYGTTKFMIPNKQGTIVVFQPHLLHEVLPITEGIRITINMGWYGPAFK